MDKAVKEAIQEYLAEVRAIAEYALKAYLRIKSSKVREIATPECGIGQTAYRLLKECLERAYPNTPVCLILRSLEILLTQGESDITVQKCANHAERTRLVECYGCRETLQAHKTYVKRIWNKTVRMCEKCVKMYNWEKLDNSGHAL